MLVQQFFIEFSRSTDSPLTPGSIYVDHISVAQDFLTTTAATRKTTTRSISTTIVPTTTATAIPTISTEKTTTEKDTINKIFSWNFDKTGTSGILFTSTGTVRYQVTNSEQITINNTGLSLTDITSICISKRI